MKTLLVCCFGILLVSSPALAKDDGKIVKRMLYADVWKRNITAFFTDNSFAVPSVNLSKNVLIIKHDECKTPEVREALNEMFAEPNVKEVLRDIDMYVVCVPTATSAGTVVASAKEKR